MICLEPYELSTDGKNIKKRKILESKEYLVSPRKYSGELKVCDSTESNLILVKNDFILKFFDLDFHLFFRTIDEY